MPFTWVIESYYQTWKEPAGSWTSTEAIQLAYVMCESPDISDVLCDVYNDGDIGSGLFVKYKDLPTYLMVF